MSPGKRKGPSPVKISSPMLQELGVGMAIVGHSERRQLFAEDDTMINRRLHGALAGGIRPVLCIGETLAEREAGQTFQVLESQLRLGLTGISSEQMGQVVLAYEPVWAIGTGKTASKEQAQEVHAFVRQLLVTIFEKNIASAVRILYGGSVKPENIDELMAQPDIDGALVGGAALQGRIVCPDYSVSMTTILIVVHVIVCLFLICIVLLQHGKGAVSAHLSVDQTNRCSEPKGRCHC